jgi:molybdenum cofactor cytidylyltransferase
MSPQPQIAALILAAGESSRLGQPKQLIQFRGKTLMRRVVDAASEAGCRPVLVILGKSKRTSNLRSPGSPGGAERHHGIELAEAISSELKKTGATIVANPNWKRGIGTSIRAGVQHLIELAPGAEATVLLACDQPFVDRVVIDRLITLHHETRKPIVAARYAGTLGVPALFDRGRLPDLLGLDDSAGAKSIILSNRDQVAEFPFPEGEIDIDTPEDRERFCATSDSQVKNQSLTD